MLLIARGKVDEAMLLVCQSRRTVLGVTPKQAHLVRAGLAAGRLLDSGLPPLLKAPRPKPLLQVVLGLWLISLTPKWYLVVNRDGTYGITQDLDAAEAWPSRESGWEWADDNKQAVAEQLGVRAAHNMMVVKKGGKRGD